MTSAAQGQDDRLPMNVYHEKATIAIALRRALKTLTPAEIRDELEAEIRARDRCACGTVLVTCSCGDSRCPKCDPEDCSAAYPQGCAHPDRCGSDGETCCHQDCTFSEEAQLRRRHLKALTSVYTTEDDDA